MQGVCIDGLDLLLIVEMAYLFRGVLLADLLLSLPWFPLACGISGSFLFVSYSATWQLQLNPSPDHLPSLSSVFLSAALSLYVCVFMCFCLISEMRCNRTQTFQKPQLLSGQSTDNFPKCLMVHQDVFG